MEVKILVLMEEIHSLTLPLEELIKIHQDTLSYLHTSLLWITDASDLTDQHLKIKDTAIRFESLLFLREQIMESLQEIANTDPQ